MIELAVHLDNVKKTFNEKDFVLNGLNLKIPKGKLTVIIGYSGTGKSVMLKHILGLIKPTSGKIEVLGKDLWKMTEEELICMRCSIGVLFQSAALFDDQTVIENVCFPLIEHRRGMSQSDLEDIALKKLKAAGLGEEHINKLPSELSGGMQKRVGLARALSLEPDVLIYDEPTTGLDPILTERIDNLLLETHQNNVGNTSIVVSHDLLAAFRIGDYIVMLDRGKVLLSGSPEEFMNSEIELVKKFILKGIDRK